MQIVIGSMWDRMKKRGGFSEFLRPVLIVPALAGAMVCYLIVWMPVSIWPSRWVFVLSTLLLLVLFFSVTAAVARLLSNRIFSIELAVRTLGVLLALLIGCIHFIPKLFGTPWTL